MQAVVSLVRRHPLISFFVLTYILCWGGGAILNGTPVAPSANFLAGVPLAALIIAALAEGRRGVLDLGRRLVRWRVGWRWYAVIFALPVVIVGMALVVLPLVGGTPWTGRSGRALPRSRCFSSSSLSSRSAPRWARRWAGVALRCHGCWLTARRLWPA